jgi:hypothetical protein
MKCISQLLFPRPRGLAMAGYAQALNVRSVKTTQASWPAVITVMRFAGRVAPAAAHTTAPGTPDLTSQTSVAL